MKGQVEIVLGGIIFTIFVVAFIMIPLIFLKVHLVTMVEYEGTYDNAQLGLLVFLSSTETVNGKIMVVSDILANHIAFNDPSDITFLKPTLDGIFSCYKLSGESGVLLQSLQSNCNPTKATAKTEIALPFGMYEEILTLVIN